MQHAKDLVRLLRELTGLIEAEAEQNPVFAEKLGAILAPAARRPGKGGKRASAPPDLPDVYAEYQRLGETEFGFWLRGLDLVTVKWIVKKNGFDPAKQSRRWKEAERFVPLVVEQVRARLRRGSGFLTPAAGKAGQGSGLKEGVEGGKSA